MELHQYIRELLFRHDCIMLPEFGGFVANYRPAEVNYLTHTFSPPSKDIVFNAGLKDNDGLLIGYISKKSGMSYVDARKWLDKQIKELSRKLEKGKKIYLEDIGTFHLGKDQNLLFEPANSVNYLTETYGLTDFNFSPLEDLTRQHKERSSTLSLGMRKTLRWVAVAVPIIAILTLVPTKTTWLDNIHIDLSDFNPFHAKQDKNESSVTKDQDENNVIPESKQHIPSTVNEPAVEEPATTEPAAEEAKVVPDVVNQPTYKYYIIAGSFQSRSNAEIMQSKLIGQGKDAVIMKGPDGFFRVAYGDYTDKGVAEHELTGVRQIKGQENYWMLRK